MCLFNHAMHKTTFYIIKLLCIKAAKLQNVTSVSICDVRSGSGKSFIVRIVLEEGTKTRLVEQGDTRKHDFFYCYLFSPSKLVTKRACPLYQWIASHTTTMNKVGGAKGGEYGIFKMKS